MRTNLKLGLNRLFVVLTPIWVVYCLLVYPMQRLADAEKLEQADYLYCLEHRSGDVKSCTDYAKLLAGTDAWTLRAFYTRESWLLALVVVVVPLLAYGCCRVLIWIWRGFVPAS